MNNLTPSTEVVVMAHGAGVDFYGRPAFAHVIDRLKLCDSISRVIAVCDPAWEAAVGADVIVPTGSCEADSVIAGLQEASSADRCIVMTGDLPLVTPEAVNDFLASAPVGDVVYPVVRQQDMDAAFPGRKPFYVSAVEGKFTGSSILLVRSEIALTKTKILTDLLNARREPTALLGILGPGIALKFMFSKLSINTVEESLSRALGLKCKVFISGYPELTVSIDGDEDARKLERMLSGS